MVISTCFQRKPLSFINLEFLSFAEYCPQTCIILSYLDIQDIHFQQIPQTSQFKLEWVAIFWLHRQFV